MYQDKTLICKDCGAEFVFTAGEQQFYAEERLRERAAEMQRVPYGAQKRRCKAPERNVHRNLRFLRCGSTRSV